MNDQHYLIGGGDYVTHKGQMRFAIINVSIETTLNIIFSVTYYLRLHNIIIIYCITLFFSFNGGQIGCVDIVEHLHIYLVKMLHKKQLKNRNYN